MSNMYEFWRTCEPAVQKRDALPTLGQGRAVQEFVEEHKVDFTKSQIKLVVTLLCKAFSIVQVKIGFKCRGFKYSGNRGLDINLETEI